MRRAGARGRQPSRPSQAACATGLAVTLAVCAGPALGQVILDGSIGPEPAGYPVGSDMGFTYWITEDLGALAVDNGRANLFHSFSQFDIHTGESASFVDTTNSGIIENIIARVTCTPPSMIVTCGPSMIDGLIQSQIAGASLFLLNPAGIMFQPNAQLDLTGSGYFSTAPVLRFPDGVDFEAGEALPPATLSAADPTAFGFRLEEPAAPIDLQLSAGFGKDGEFLGPGGTLGFVAGSVNLTAFPAVSQTIATGETVAMAAVAAATVDVPVDIPSFDVSGFEPGELGPVRISDNAFVILTNRATQGGSDQFSTGRLVVRAGSFVLGSGTPSDRTQILACTSPANCNTGAPARENVVDVAVAGDGDLAAPDVLVEGASGGRARISLRTTSDAIGGVRIAGPSVAVRGGTGLAEIELINISNSAAGELRITADELRIEDGGEIRSAALGNPASTGAGANLRLAASEVVVGNEGLVYSVTRNAGSGGSIEIDAGNLSVDGGLIASEHLASGAGGEIDITATDTVEVRGFGGIVSGAELFPAPAVADAPGGDIRVSADTIRVLGESTDQDFTAPQIAAIANSDDPASPGGDIFLTAREVVLENGGAVITSTENASDAGSIQISGPLVRGQEVGSPMPAELLLIDGLAQINGKPAPAGLFARTRGTGDAGSIEMAARVVEVRAGGVISASAAEAMGAANAGSIRIEQAERVTLDSQSVAGFESNLPLISVRARDGSQTGDVLIATDVFELLAGGGIEADTEGSARASAIRVEARDMLIDGFFGEAPGITPSGISSQSRAGGSGDAGDIDLIVGEHLTISNLANVSVLAVGGGRAAGDITIQGSTADVVLTDGAEVLANLGETGPGNDPADVVIGSVNSLTLDNGAAIRAETEFDGQGGVVQIQTLRGLSLANGSRISTLSLQDAAAAGDAGDIEISALTLSVDSASDITAQTEGPGDAGLIDIDIRDHAVLSNGGRVVSSSFGDGAAGSIDFRAAELLIDGGGLPADTASAIAAETDNAGAGGNVSVLASRSITLQRGGRISSSSLGEQSDAGDAGNVLVDGGRELVLTSGSSITTDTFRSGEQTQGASGGKITLRATELVYLEDSDVSTSVFEGAGGGGDIGIPNLPIPEGGSQEGDTAAPPAQLVLNRSSIRANAQQGPGGNILISAGTIFRSAESVIEAVSQLGVDGNVDISAPDSDLAGQVTPLTTRFFDASELMLPACAARTSRAGSFTIQTRAVQPPPDAPLPASLATSADPTRGAACSS